MNCIQLENTSEGPSRGQNTHIHPHRRLAHVRLPSQPVEVHVLLQSAALIYLATRSELQLQLPLLLTSLDNTLARSPSHSDPPTLERFPNRSERSGAGIDLGASG